VEAIRTRSLKRMVGVNCGFDLFHSRNATKEWMVLEFNRGWPIHHRRDLGLIMLDDIFMLMYP